MPQQKKKKKKKKKEEEEDAPPAGEEPAQFVPPDAGQKTVTSDEYLQSTVTYDGDKLLDDDLNGVMMAWETDIMRRSVAALLPDPAAPGKRILNIGFGMGIVDGLFAARSPAKHHIIEAHPGVLAHVARGGTQFGGDWERSGPRGGCVQDVPRQVAGRGADADGARRAVRRHLL